MSPECLKCGGEMDKGTLSQPYRVVYKSDKLNRSFFSIGHYDQVTNVSVCIQCGHVEMYINPDDLRRRLGRSQRR